MGEVMPRVKLKITEKTKKKNINNIWITEEQLVGVDDTMPLIMWLELFVKA